jgi:hypothetical protein
MGSKNWAIFKTNAPILGINTLVKNQEFPQFAADNSLRMC